MGYGCDVGEARANMFLTTQYRPAVTMRIFTTLWYPHLSQCTSARPTTLGAIDHPSIISPQLPTMSHMHASE